MFGKIKKFLSEAQEEWHHINWPTRQEGLRLTLIVIGISVGLAVFLSLFDFIFSYILKSFVIK